MTGNQREFDKLHELFNAPKIPEDLAEVVTIWQYLPEHIKAAIKALIQSNIQGGK